MGFFDNLFGKKEKKEEEVDPLDIRLTKLKAGYILDYDLSSWEVKEVYNYDWVLLPFVRAASISSSRLLASLAIEP